MYSKAMCNDETSLELLCLMSINWQNFDPILHWPHLHTTTVTVKHANG